ncbi:MAG: asparagine synthase (glutamine-hydrolyzing) [Alphaproteobacteria bacterium]|nr:asparagine synthase (glutamine-hydrolyzing) [Alphaproteobacteria bacterium]
MCGIAGLVDLGGIERGAAERRMAAALARLSLRGPDGHGTWADARTMLGHTRLAVIDLSAAANQPMVRDGLVITFNGEIYNHRAVRAELESLGRRFTTQSDTEVLLEGWHAWGPALLPKLVGMFALALWDARAGALFLARDTFGKKPLLYAAAGGRLAFASDLNALEALEGTRRPLDPVATRLYFALRYVPEPYAIAQGVAKLSAGHWARFDANGVAIARWHDPAADRPSAYADETEAAADLAHRFDEAIAARTVADVPIGAFLSGGIDSAIVAASLARQTARVRTFTVGFPGASAYYEERPEARAVALHLGTDHTEVELTPREALDALDAVFENLDEPFADSSALPTFLLSRATRRHVTVALSGDGADEAFGGYRKYQGELLASAYGRVPRVLRAGLIEPAARLLPEGKDTRLLEAFRRARRFLAHAGAPAIERQAGWARLLPDAELDRVLGPEPAAPSVERLIAAARAAAGHADSLNAMLAAEMAVGLVGDMLVKVDRMSMANSLEVRCPFLDRRVVAAAFAMPGAYKLRRGEGKRVLRRAFADRLPAEVFARPKKGFEVPIARWLLGDLKDRLVRAIDPARLKREGLIDPAAPARWLAALKSGRRDTSAELWTVLAFQEWRDRHGGTA